MQSVILLNSQWAVGFTWKKKKRLLESSAYGMHQRASEKSLIQRLSYVWNMRHQSASRNL